MHFASPRIFVRMPLSGVPIISSRTLAELSRRLTISGSVFASCASNFPGLVAFGSEFFVSGGCLVASPDRGKAQQYCWKSEFVNESHGTTPLATH